MATIELKKQDREFEIQVEKKIQNEDTQKRYYVAELIRKALNQYLDYDDMKAESRYSVYTMPIVNETLDIIDFEINSLNVHVIPTIDKAKNQNVYIPKSYKVYNCKPDMIIFVNFTKGLTKMSIEGFIANVNLNTLAIPKSSLRPVEALIDALKTIEPRPQNAEDNVVKTASELMLAYIDSSLSEEGEQFFLKHFLSNKQIRKNYKLFYALNCQFISVAKKHKSLSDDNFVAIDSVSEENDFIEHIDDIPQEISNVAETLSVQEYSSDISPQDEAALDDAFNDTDDEAVQTLEQDELLAVESEETQDALQSTFDDMVDAVGQEEVISDNIPVNDELPQGEPVELLNEDEQVDFENDTSDSTPDASKSDIVEDVQIDDTDTMADGDMMELDEFSGEDMPELDFSSFDGDESVDLTEQEVALGDLDVSEENVKNEPPKEQEILLRESVVPQEQKVELVMPEQQADEPQVEEVVASSEEPSSADAEISGDDVFSFLSEMADEAQAQEVPPHDSLTLPQDENAEIKSDEQPETAMVQQSEPIVNNVPDEVQVSEPSETPSDGEVLNNAFSGQMEQSNTIEYIPQQQQTVPEEKPKNKGGLQSILVLVVIIAAVGGVGFFFKDKIPFLNKSSDMQDLVEENNGNKMPDLPAPIDNTADLDGAVPPPITGNDAQTPPAPTADIPAPIGATAPAGTTQTAPPPVPTKTSEKPAAANGDSAVPSLPKAIEPPKPKHLNDAIATALTKDFSGVRISKVSWEVSETLINNSDVKRYLTIAGKSIKNALSQDLMSATEPSFKDVVIADIVYKKDGTVSNVKISSSSGSSQIDNIVEKSIKDTLNYIKMPALNINKPEFTAKLVVRL